MRGSECKNSIVKQVKWFSCPVVAVAFLHRFIGLLFSERNHGIGYSKRGWCAIRSWPVSSRPYPLNIFVFNQRFALSADANLFGRIIRCQDLLTELPDDTCPIPEPPEIPTIPDAEDGNDNSGVFMVSANRDQLEPSSVTCHTSTSHAGLDQTRICAGRNRWVCHREHISYMLIPSLTGNTSRSRSYESTKYCKWIKTTLLLHWTENRVSVPHNTWIESLHTSVRIFVHFLQLCQFIHVYDLATK